MARVLTPEQKIAKSERARKRREAKRVNQPVKKSTKPIASDQDGVLIYAGDWVTYKDGGERHGKAIARDGFGLEIECHDDRSGEKYTRVVNRFWKDC